jgi:hypothetical protein
VSSSRSRRQNERSCCGHGRHDHLSHPIPPSVQPEPTCELTHCVPAHGSACLTWPAHSRPSYPKGSSIPQRSDNELEIPRLIRCPPLPGPSPRRNRPRISAKTSKSATRNGHRRATTATNTSTSAASTQAAGTSECHRQQRRTPDPRPTCGGRPRTRTPARTTGGTGGRVIRTVCTSPGGAGVVDGAVRRDSRVILLGGGQSARFRRHLLVLTGQRRPGRRRAAGSQRVHKTATSPARSWAASRSRAAGLSGLAIWPAVRTTCTSSSIPG